MTHTTGWTAREECQRDACEDQYSAPELCDCGEIAPLFEGRCQHCWIEIEATQHPVSDGLFQILEDALGDLLSASIELERERPHYAHEDVQTALARLALVLFGPQQCAA